MSNELQQLSVLTTKELQAASYDFAQAFQLRLAGDQWLYLEEVKRIVPKKRLVAFGTWKGKAVVAKLFFHPRDAKHHMEKDAAGTKMLREHKVPTPALYYQGYSADKRVYVLLYQRIYEARTLQEIWQTALDKQTLLPIMHGVMIELATQHVLGLLQQDLHLGNFLLTKKTIFTLDGGQIELFPHLLSKKVSMNNLALFLSQLGIGIEELQEKLFKFYAKARGWLLKPEDTVELFLAIKKCNEERWKHFQQKIFRNCTQFGRITDWGTEGMYDRRYAGNELQAFLHDPESAFRRKDIEVLKNGRSSSVIAVMMDQRVYVVKRYNIKNMSHRLRRLFRQTRARKSWRLAQKLLMFGIKTAQPVAYVEKKWLGCCGKSYYITEYVSGGHAGEFFLKHRGDAEKTKHMIESIVGVLKNTAKLEFTHGDLKITNILVDKDDQPILIDLDGAAEHLSLSSLRSSWRKEIKRFLQNFADMPILKEKFIAALGD
jgi:tRNA A-37 threonylcarbamoyl transferase component Bud32